MKFTYQIAARHLRSPQKGSFSTFAGILAIFGLGLGISALILTFSIIEGFEQAISQKIAQFDGHLRIDHFLDIPFSEADPFLDSVLVASPVDIQTAAYIQNPALLRKGSSAEGVVAVGLDAGNGHFEGLQSIIVDGNSTLSPGNIVIGKRLADKLGIILGDRLVLFDLYSMGQLGSRKRLKQLTVVGLFHSGLLEYDRTITYLNIHDAQYLFNMEHKVSGRIITLIEPKELNTLRNHLNDFLSYPYFMLSWKEKHRILFDWIALQKWPILIIFGLIAFVGVVNIISSLSMIIFEKFREIGILKALGFSNKIIKQIFLIEGIIIGGLGSIIGCGIALGIAVLQIKFQIISIPEDIYFMDHIPIGIDWMMTLMIFLMGILSAMLAAFWPTLKAGSIQPAEAMRYE
ncbi:MAG: FtsX-like permease family protein [Candidatus Neomarinimicrobiota bacterium]